MQNLKGLKIGYALTGSFCTFSESFKLIEKLVELNVEIFPIISFNVQSIKNRFITPEKTLEFLESKYGGGFSMSININSVLNNQEEFWSVNLEGELDVSTADKLKEHLHGLADKEILDMKINLENLEYIDSTGLGVMIGVLKKLKVGNKEIYIVNPRSNVRKIFNITGLDKIFKVEG